MSAAFAAGAESLVTGELAVCAASCGPGNTHLVQGLYDAHRNGAKVLAIASHIPSRQIGSYFFQDTRPEMLFAECSGYCEIVNSAEHVIEAYTSGVEKMTPIHPEHVADLIDEYAADDAIFTR